MLETESSNFLSVMLLSMSLPDIGEPSEILRQMGTSVLKKCASSTKVVGAHGSAVGKALCYKLYGDGVCFL
jgi:hypothetical protein